jgi:hypothetical protein
MEESIRRNFMERVAAIEIVHPFDINQALVAEVSASAFVVHEEHA